MTNYRVVSVGDAKTRKRLFHLVTASARDCGASSDLAIQIALRVLELTEDEGFAITRQVS